MILVDISKGWIIPIGLIIQSSRFPSDRNACHISFLVDADGVESQGNSNEDDSSERCHDRSFRGNVPRRISTLEHLRTNDVPNTECHQNHGIHSDFFGVTSDITARPTVDHG